MPTDAIWSERTLKATAKNYRFEIVSCLPHHGPDGPGKSGWAAAVAFNLALVRQSVTDLMA